MDIPRDDASHVMTLQATAHVRASMESCAEMRLLIVASRAAIADSRRMLADLDGNGRR